MLALGKQWRILLFIALLPLTTWSQQTAPVTLEVAPKDMAIAAGERRQALVIATVTGSPVRNLKLRARTEPGTHAGIGRIAKLPDEVRGNVSWPVYISKDADGKTSSRIIFEAQYETGDANAPVPGIADVALDLTVKQRPKNEDVATASIQSSFDKLEEQRPQDVYLLVTNMTDVPLQVTGVSASLPSFVGLMTNQKCVLSPQGDSAIYSSAGQTKPLTIPPRRDQTFHAALCIPPYTPVLAGKYLMLFEVRLSYAKDGYTTGSSVVQTKDFQAGVLGEQEFVGVTSVPFLLLPGFLVVTVLGLLLSKVWPKWSFEVDYKKPEFYLFGVVVSMLIVFVLYRSIGRWLYLWLWKVDIQGRKLLAGYSLEDIINIWVIAIALAVLPWALIGGIARLFAALKARLLKKQTPTPQDRALDVLLRLRVANQPFNLKQATLGNERLWELPLPSPDPAKKWLSGRVCVRFPDLNAVAADQRAAVTAAQNQFRGLVNQSGETAALYNLLYGVRNRVEILWQPDRPPELVDKKDAPTVTAAPDEFVSEG
jgi:hypothetical protein